MELFIKFDDFYFELYIKIINFDLLIEIGRTYTNFWGFSLDNLAKNFRQILQEEKFLYF